MAFSVGETLQADKYRLHAVLDQHQWGMTFLATHQGVDQQVVIKTFQSDEKGPSSLQLKSYLDYGEKLRRFHHPNLSRVISLFEEKGQACMVSEFIQGIPLHQLIQRQPLDENTAITYIRQVAQGLHALHRHGLLHLNLSPSRILKRQGDGKIALVGLNSRFASQAAERNSNPYLSFEQHQLPANPSLASEIYSISAILYKLVTGQDPVLAPDRSQTPLIPPRQHRAELSQSTEAAIMTGMALAPTDRPQRIKDWVKLLPQASKAAAKTTLQIPSAWQVKLPAFQDAGLEEGVSTVIEASPPVQATAIQPAPQQPCPPEQVIQTVGHAEVDTVLPELTETASSVADVTTLQAQAQRRESPAAPPSLEPASATPVATGPDIPAPEVPAKTPSAMSATLPRKQTSRFPKWALFWCALLAGCGGLGAGLWFRLQLTRQFAMPSIPVETTPLDQLKTLDRKEEEFLPTQTSIIPEEKNRNEGETYEFETSTDSSFNSDVDENDLDPELGERDAADKWQAPSSWDSPANEVAPIDTPVPGAVPPATEFSSDSDGMGAANSDLPISPSYANDDPYGQAIEQPVESGDFDAWDNDTLVEPLNESRYRSDGSSYDPTSDTF